MKDKKMPVPDSGFDSKKYRIQINNEFSDCVIPELLIENRQIVHAALSTRITARRAGYPDRWQGESAWVFPRCE
ncbi:hypothetical protein [Burkholderia ubonensis]|uniref:hypothetical protein n=1 Tax=Burkholderia ubonensis TaxID=101571 RepID=UPI000A8B0706|nr:hypothetical protein [Burkholderia ubonensis]